MIRHEGKLHQRNLETTVRAIANRKLENERRKITAVDKRAVKVTLGLLCDELNLPEEVQAKLFRRNAIKLFPVRK